MSVAESGRCGRGTRTLRQRPAGQPAAEPSSAACMSGRERDRKVRHRPAPPWPDRQIRSLVLRVELVGSRRIYPAQVECLVDPDGSRRRICSDPSDDQRDDQAPRQVHHWEQVHPWEGRRVGGDPNVDLPVMRRQEPGKSESAGKVAQLRKRRGNLESSCASQNIGHIVGEESSIVVDGGSDDTRRLPAPSQDS